MWINNNPEQFTEDLNKRIKEIDSEIKRLKADTRLTVAGKAQLNALEWEITKINKLDQLSPSRKDGINRAERRDVRKLGREIEKYESRLIDIKISLGIDEFAKPPVMQRRAYDVWSGSSVEQKDGNMYFTGTDAKGNKSTINIGRIPTQEEKKVALDRIDNKTATAEDYKTVWAWLIDHVVSKNTHATPEQAKMIKYGAVAAWGILLWKFLNSNIPWWIFSLNGMAALGAIYAGTTMATGMNPLEFANSIINGGKYPLLWIDDVDWENWEKSPVKKARDNSQFSDQLINGFKDPMTISKYIKPKQSTGQWATSGVMFDMKQFLQDVSIWWQPIEDFSNLKCALDQNKINEIFWPYNGHSANELMAMILWFTQSGRIDLLDQALTEHFATIGGGKSATDLLADPQALKEQSKKFTEDLKNNAKAVTKFVLSKPEFKWYKIADEHEISILNQMMTIEKEINPQFVANPSTYVPTMQMDYDLLKQTLIVSGDIKEVSLADSPEARANTIKDIKSLLLANPGLIEASEQLKFAEAFAKVKGKYDTSDNYKFDIRVVNQWWKKQLWVQTSTSAFAFSGDDESTFNVDFGSMGTSVGGGVNIEWWFEHKLAYAMASSVLIWKVAWNIVRPADKEVGKIYPDWPFKIDGKSISVSTNTGWIKLWWNASYKVVNQIMDDLQVQLWDNKAWRKSLCAMFNGMSYAQWSQNAWKSIWDINNGALPPSMMPMDKNDNRKINTWFDAGKAYVVTDAATIGEAVKNIWKFTVWWVKEMWSDIYNEWIKSAVVQWYKDATEAAKTLYRDLLVKWTHQIYEDVKSGAKMFLVDMNDGWWKLMWETVVNGVKTVVDITGKASKEIYQKLLWPLYQEIKLQAPKFLKDVEWATEAMYNSLKKWWKMVESDTKSWLKWSGKDRYQNYIKEATKELYKDASWAIDHIGRDLGAKLAWIWKRTVESVFGALWFSAEQASKFNGEHPWLSWALTWIIASAAGAADGVSILTWVATLILWWMK